MRILPRFGIPAAVLLIGVTTAAARVYLTQADALAIAFPAPHDVERRTIYLDAAQVERTAALAGGPVDSRVVPCYIGRMNGRIAGYAYFDTHLVRTLPETVMIVVDPGGSIRRIDILSFEEPPDYLPGERWLQQFPGRELGPGLALNQQIRAVTGATLSSRAITQAVRRTLAIHRLWIVASAEKPQAAPPAATTPATALPPASGPGARP